MSNEIILNGKLYKMESIWRKSKDDKSKDSRGNIFSFPKEQNGWSGSKQFINNLCNVQDYLDQKNLDKVIDSDKCVDCLLCKDKCVTTKRYSIKRFIWDDGLMHYMTKHNIKPSDEFISMIYKVIENNINASVNGYIKLVGRIKKEIGIKYIKIDTNQIMILDALMRHGGYTKKYFDVKKKNTYRYSEHAGVLDIHEYGLDKIIVSGNTSRIDRGDEEIYLPNDLPDMFDYEYIFHTHPPTPKPGGRAKDGILFEFPSMGDLFHFIDHYNDGKTIGSLVMTSEGLYNIRKIKFDKKKINLDENKFYADIKKQFKYAQRDAIEKYGVNFTTYDFYSKIAQDTKYIDSINEKLFHYNLTIDFFPRKKDKKGSWHVTSIYLKIFN